MQEKRSKNYRKKATPWGLKWLVSIAWRNLWRNKRRTLITVSSIFFGVIFSALMGSMQEGSYQKMIEYVVRFYAGHAQIQHADYPDHQSINNSFAPSDSLLEKLNGYAGLKEIVPRLESFALASSGSKTEGVIVKFHKVVYDNLFDYYISKLTQ
jgi:putative ABC transport system permease protein